MNRSDARGPMNSLSVRPMFHRVPLEEHLVTMLNCQQHEQQQGDLSGAPVAVESAIVLHQIIISALVVTCFVCTKTLVDGLRRRNARVSVVIVGAGPIGVTSMLVAARTGRVSQIVVYEEVNKHALFNRPHQIAFDPKSVHFLKRLGVDFDNIEGCWDMGSFFTRIGVFQEYMLTTIPRLDVPVTIRLGTKSISRLAWSRDPCTTYFIPSVSSLDSRHVGAPRLSGCCRDHLDMWGPYIIWLSPCSPGHVGALDYLAVTMHTWTYGAPRLSGCRRAHLDMWGP
ncbi:hypothetical protein Btru_060970 [Bulinus truncatus]|nr:hypothetical protein Btru_060970 [Bulinus truncatus]